jgi:hypothetical protein
MISNKEINNVIDHLTQVSYNTQRKLYPEIKASRWGKIYGEGVLKKLENNFQKQLTIESK